MMESASVKRAASKLPQFKSPPLLAMHVVFQENGFLRLWPSEPFPF